jgi:hypothetical protein
MSGRDFQKSPERPYLHLFIEDKVNIASHFILVYGVTFYLDPDPLQIEYVYVTSFSSQET